MFCWAPGSIVLAQFFVVGSNDVIATIMLCCVKLNVCYIILSLFSLIYIQIIYDFRIWCVHINGSTPMLDTSHKNVFQCTVIAHVLPTTFSHMIYSNVISHLQQYRNIEILSMIIQSKMNYHPLACDADLCKYIK